MNNKEYNLDFFEAMAALKEGHELESTYSDSRYFLKDGLLLARSKYNNGTAAPSGHINDYLTTKFRIVEPEKCWLDKKVECGDRGCKDLAKELAREAIQRIFLLDGNDYQLKAINILKDLIGDSK